MRKSKQHCGNWAMPTRKSCVAISHCSGEAGAEVSTKLIALASLLLHVPWDLWLACSVHGVEGLCRGHCQDLVNVVFQTLPSRSSPSSPTMAIDPNSVPSTDHSSRVKCCIW